MKTEILFVDDERFVLEGLKRSLHSMRQNWEMHFVNSGREALEFLAHTHCDVVVSDMHMSGMSGAELLNQVMSLYPETVRFILSGHSDRNLILQCVKSTDQFLIKPCNLEDLKSKIAQVSAGGPGKNRSVSEIIAKMEPLPSRPALYDEIAKARQDPAVTVEQVGEIIARDIAMTAKILKVVNSSFFGLGEKLSCVMEATLYLGLETIHSLILVADAFSQYEKVNPKASGLQAIWNHSSQVAAAAKFICHLETKNSKLAQECFVAGMLHDIGKLGLASHFADQYNEALHYSSTQKVKFFEAEQYIFGTDHAEIGAALLRRWGLPPSLGNAVAFHHHPGCTEEKSPTALTFVHVANALIHREIPAEAEFYADGIDWNYLETVGLQSEGEEWRAALKLAPMTTR